jgi:hypothetical protein
LNPDSKSKKSHSKSKSFEEEDDIQVLFEKNKKEIQKLNGSKQGLELAWIGDTDKEERER